MDDESIKSESAESEPDSAKEPSLVAIPNNLSSPDPVTMETIHRAEMSRLIDERLSEITAAEKVSAMFQTLTERLDSLALEVTGCTMEVTNLVALLTEPEVAESNLETARQMEEIQEESNSSPEQNPQSQGLFARIW